MRFWGLGWGTMHSPEEKGKSVYLSMAVHNFIDAAVFCKFMPPCDIMSGKEIADLMSAITGMELTRDDLTAIGERLVALKRAFNIRCGLTRADDRLPRRLMTPAPDAGGKHAEVQLEVMMRDFYEAAGWDWNTGKPRQEKLVSLDLDDVAKDLWA